MLESIYSIRLGHCGTIYRWKSKCTIAFNVDRRSFSDDSYATYAIECLEAAAHLWNEGDVGVQFERVADHERATFRLVYEHQHGATIAKAFPPNAVAYGQPRLIVFPASIGQTGYCDNLVGVFCHELGHVLGLRHEHKEDAPSVLWGEANPLSVMNYFNDPKQFKIDDNDLKEVRDFYAYRGTHWMGLSIVDVDFVDFDPPSY